MSFNYAVNVTIKGNDYRILFSYMSKMKPYKKS